MKILAIFHSKIFCKNQGNFSDKECSQKKFGLVPIITSLFWWSNVLVRWSKYQINFHRGVLQKLYNFRWLAASLWEKLDTTAQSVFDRADSWTGKVYHHLAAKRRTHTVKSSIVLFTSIIFYILKDTQNSQNKRFPKIKESTVSHKPQSRIVQSNNGL